MTPDELAVIDQRLDAATPGHGPSARYWSTQARDDMRALLDEVKALRGLVKRMWEWGPNETLSSHHLNGLLQDYPETADEGRRLLAELRKLGLVE